MFFNSIINQKDLSGVGVGAALAAGEFVVFVVVVPKLIGWLFAGFPPPSNRPHKLLQRVDVLQFCGVFVENLFAREIHLGLD